MLKKYSHFSDLQATDKYKTNSTIGCMLKLNRAFTATPPPPALHGSLQHGGRWGVKNFRKVFAGRKGAVTNFYLGEGGYIV